MPVETVIVTRSDTPSIPLDHGDVVKTPDGLTAKVCMVYYDRWHTGNSPDLINLEFEDGTSKRGYSTADYVSEIVTRIKDFPVNPEKSC